MSAQPSKLSEQDAASAAAATPRPLLVDAGLPAAEATRDRRGQGRLRSLRLGPQGRACHPRRDREGLRRPSQDAAPGRQRGRRGRRVRRHGRHPPPDLAGGGAIGRTRAAARPRSRVRGRTHLRLAGRRFRAGEAALAPDPASQRAAGLGRARGPRLERSARSDRAGGGAALLADRRARARRRGSRPHPLRRRDRDREVARRPRRLAVGRELRLQGDGRSPGPAGLLRGSLRRALRDRLAARPQPVLDQHVAVVHARAALLRPRSQRRDQHRRAAARGGAHARRADSRRLLRLAGPEPPDRDPHPPARPLAGRGDGAGGPADRERDPPVPRGAARLLHVPAAGHGPVRAGTDRADRAQRRRVRVLGRRTRPSPAVGDPRR